MLAATRANTLQLGKADATNMSIEHQVHTLWTMDMKETSYDLIQIFPIIRIT